MCNRAHASKSFSAFAARMFSISKRGRCALCCTSLGSVAWLLFLFFLLSVAWITFCFVQYKMKGSGKSLNSKNSKSQSSAAASSLSITSSPSVSISPDTQGSKKRKRDDNGQLRETEASAKRLAVEDDGVDAVLVTPSIPTTARNSVNASAGRASPRDAFMEPDCNDDVPPLIPLSFSSPPKRVDAVNVNTDIPKTALEQKLAAENAAMKIAIAEQEAKKAKRRLKTRPAHIHIPPKLHPFLLPLCVDKTQPGPLFVSGRKTLSGEEKRPDQDTMLKMIRAAAKRAGLEDWVCTAVTFKMFIFVCLCVRFS